jgi:hypothetical protein
VKAEIQRSLVWLSFFRLKIRKSADICKAPLISALEGNSPTTPRFRHCIIRIKSETILGENSRSVEYFRLYQESNTFPHTGVAFGSKMQFNKLFVAYFVCH